MYVQDRCQNGKTTSLKDLETAIESIRGAIMIVFPMGLPEYEPVREICDDQEELAGTAVIFFIFFTKKK